MNLTMVSTLFLGPTRVKQLTLFRHITLTVVGNLLIALTSKIQSLFYPVPMTVQTLMVLTIGMAYGWRLAAAILVLTSWKAQWDSMFFLALGAI